MRKYIPGEIEKKWQEKWKEKEIYQFESDSQKPKFYELVEFTYPSGDLHIGHWFTFAVPDVLARMKRAQGYNVLFPNGFDAFGLPAENAAMKRGIHPQDFTLNNIKKMKEQFGLMGATYNWDHEVITCEPEYYRWNQWIFLKMYEKGLIYRGKTLSNWCPMDQTVLANENIESGKCWRCGSVVIQKEIEQWFIKITDYADTLIWPDDPSVDWPLSVRIGQNNWIGKSEGVRIKFDGLEVFTTRSDTLFGVTFMVISPEHPLLKTFVTDDKKQEIEEYLKLAGQKTELERKENKEKTGVFTGSFVTNPVTNEKVPVWVADYVLTGYGTGAIMAVPAHDERDFEFATKFDLPIKQVIATDIETLPIIGEGKMVNSGEYDGLESAEAREKITKYIEEKKLGVSQVNYHLHDWSISRQRYWGTPVPMIHCPNCGIVPVPEKDLPIELPYEVDFTPKGEPPLATNKEWLRVECPKCGGEARRDAETLDTFFDSSWYFLRYLDPKYIHGPFDESLAKTITPVNIYFGGSEHTLGHTLYARFFTKFFKKLGMIDFDEFALKRVQHGVILGPDGNRMSKSKGNVVNPDEQVAKYGADAVRLYLSFLGPYDLVAPWNPDGMNGVYHFLQRVWGLFEKVEKLVLISEDQVQMNKTVKKVQTDIEETKFNTAIAALMEWLNYLSRKEKVGSEEYKTYLKLLSPFAPHMTEELWSMLGEDFSIHTQSWPQVNEKFLVDQKVSLAIQINGKVRDIIEVDPEISEEEAVKMARESQKIKKFLDGVEVKRTIYVKGKILSFVT